ncbi:MAG: cytochrome c oxidase assembly protein, partial [Actinomycetota bacterium]
MSARSRRTAALGAGVVVAGAALLSPLNALAHELFSAHMVQHLLLMLAAAPLVVYGMPAVGRTALGKLPAVPAWA